MSKEEVIVTESKDFSMLKSTNPFDDDFEDAAPAVPIAPSSPKSGSVQEAVLEDEGCSENDNLANELADLDLDTDLWTSFRNNSSIKITKRLSTGQEIEAVNEEDIIGSVALDGAVSPKEQEDLMHWNARLERDEVYSTHYRPVPKEHQELIDLALFLGVSYHSDNKKRTSGHRLLNGLKGNLMNEITVSPVESLFHNQEPHSILLKRGPVLWKGEERELILLTHGFVLAQVNDKEESTKSSILKADKRKTSILKAAKRIIRRTYEQCELYTGVECIRDTSTPDSYKFAVDAKIRFPGNDGKNYNSKVQVFEFQCATTEHHLAWLKALERVVIQAFIHARLPDRDWGWQHQVVQTTTYSAAFIGDVERLQQLIIASPGSIDDLDPHHQMTALHYATRGNKLICIELLLEEGANENTVNSDDRTPMYYAEREGLDDAKALLESFGGTSSRHTEIEERGELFRDACIIEEERKTEAVVNAKAEEAAAKTEAVQSEMSENMRAMQQRGEKLEDIANKATSLESEAATFAGLANQLKDKTKKQSRWGF